MSLCPLGHFVELSLTDERPSEAHGPLHETVLRLVDSSSRPESASITILPGLTIATHRGAYLPHLSTVHMFGLASAAALLESMSPSTIHTKPPVCGSRAESTCSYSPGGLEKASVYGLVSG
jgi:hypothetical protein